MIEKIILLLLLYLFIKPIIGTIATAAIVAIALYPIYSKIKRRWFAFLLVVAFLALIIYVAYFSSLFLYTQIAYLISIYNNLSPEYKVPLLKVSENIPLEEFAKEIAYAIPGFIVRFPLFLIFIYYFLVDGYKIRGLLGKIFPEKADRICDRAWKNANSIVNGIFVNAFVFAFFGTIILYLAGSENALIYALLASFLGILPIITSWMIYAYAAFNLYMHGNVYGIFLIAAFIALWTLFGDTYFKMRYRGDLHPAVVFASIFLGLMFYGFPGILIGPIIVTVLHELLVEE